MSDERGYSLIEVMVAAMVVVVAMLAFATMITQQRESHIRVRQSVEATAVATRIEDFLFHSANCEKSLVGLVPNWSAGSPGILTEIKDTADNPVFWADEAGTRQEFVGLIYIDSMELQQGPVPIPADSSGMIKLVTRFDRIATTHGGPLKPRTSHIFVKTNAAGQIESCSSRALNNFNNCRRAFASGSTRATAVCDVPGEQLMSCGFEDDDQAEDSSNYVIPWLPGNTAPAPAASYLGATSDAYVSDVSPLVNYGSADPMFAGAGPPIQETYLKFDITADQIPAVVGPVLLRVFLTDGSANGPRLHSSGAFVESTVTYNSKPTLGGTIGNVGAVPSGDWIEYDISSVISGANAYHFALVGDSADPVSIASKDSATPPHLFMLVQPDAAPATGGACRCYDGDGGNLNCYAICCKW